MIKGFEKVNFWIFDLDETLYRPETGISEQIMNRMTDFLMMEYGWDYDYAKKIQKEYYYEYGSTLKGLIHHQDLEVAKRFETFSHDVDLSHIEKNDALNKALKKLPGKKYILTTSQKVYAEKMLNAMGILDNFELIWDLEATDYIAKPNPHPYQKMLVEAEMNPEQTAMFEDSYKNIVGAKNLGLKTVWIDNGKSSISNSNDTDKTDESVVDIRTKDIVKTLEELAK